MAQQAKSRHFASQDDHLAEREGNTSMLKELTARCSSTAATDTIQKGKEIIDSPLQCTLVSVPMVAARFHLPKESLRPS